MKIKICGLSRLIDIEYANELRPDFIGFVFYPKSKRAVDDERAKELKLRLDPFIKAVGVFVDEPIDHIVELVEAGTIDIVQLHGNEDTQYYEQLKARISAPIIQAIKITSSEDFKKLNEYADYYLLDNKEFGSGKSFDWSLIQKMNKPYFIAGGINIDNIDEALKLDAFAIDTSSGAETDGVKDYNKIKQLIERTRL